MGFHIEGIYDIIQDELKNLYRKNLNSKASERGMSAQFSTARIENSDLSNEERSKNSAYYLCLFSFHKNKQRGASEITIF